MTKGEHPDGGRGKGRGWEGERERKEEEEEEEGEEHMFIVYWSAFLCIQVKS